MSRDRQEFDRIVRKCATALDNFLANGLFFPEETVSQTLAALHEPDDWGSFRLASLLPLSDALTKWRLARLPPPSGGAPSPKLLQDTIDAAFLSFVLTLSAVLIAPGRVAQLFDRSERAWTAGERLRLLGPLGSLVDYVNHPSGLAERSLGGGYEVDLGFAVNAAALENIPILVHVVIVGLSYTGNLAASIRKGVACKADRELEVALRTIFVQEKALAAATEALKRAVALLPMALLNMDFVMTIEMFHGHFEVMKLDESMSSDEKRQVVTELYTPLRDAVVNWVAAAGPEDVADFDSECVLDVAHLAETVFRNATTMTPAALAATARCFDQAAALSDGSHKWMCHYTCHVLHCARAGTERLSALDDATVAFLTLLAEPTDQIFDSSELENTFFANAAFLYFISVKHALSTPRSDGNNVMALPTGRNSELYLQDFRCANAIIASLPYLNDNEALQVGHSVGALALLFRNLRIHRPTIADLCEQYDSVGSSGRKLAHFLAANCCKAAISALGGGPHAIKVDPVGDENNTAFAVFYAQLFMVNMLEVHKTTAAAAFRAQNGDERLQLQREAAAAVLRGLHVLERLGPALDEVLENPFYERVYRGPPSVPDEVVYQLRCDFSDWAEVLGPALTPGATSMLRWLTEVRGPYRGEMAKEAVAAAEKRLAAMVEAAEAVDPKNEAVAKARAEILAAGGDCAFLGCTRVRAPMPDGAKASKNRICAGCHLLRYCCAQCQRDDWKTHRIACRAIQAERGG